MQIALLFFIGVIAGFALHEYWQVKPTREAERKRARIRERAKEYEAKYGRLQ